MQIQGTTDVCTGDKLEKVVGNVEARVTNLEMNRQKYTDALRKKLDDQRAFFASKLDKKLDEDVAMTVDEHERFITDISKMATRTYLRKVLENKVKQIVNDVLEDDLEDDLEDAIEDSVQRKLKERDAAIKRILEAKADQDETDEELAVAHRALEEQRRQLAFIMA